MSKEKTDNLFGGHDPAMVLTLRAGPRAGNHGGKVPLKLKDGRTLVCLAQRGECRRNPRYPARGEWNLPQIEPGCSRKCVSRMQVADSKTEGAYLRYPEHDPNGFGWYVKPDDALGMNDTDTAPPVQPAGSWVDPNPPKPKRQFTNQGEVWDG
jgi:hypothetical protein